MRARVQEVQADIRRGVRRSQTGQDMTPRISEADWQRTVTDALTLYGWRWTHFRPANTGRGWRTPLSGSPGFPDIVAVREYTLYFIELKAEAGRLTLDQQDWQAALLECVDLDLAPRGTQYYVWRPSDFDEVMEVLK